MKLFIAITGSALLLSAALLSGCGGSGDSDSGSGTASGTASGVSGVTGGPAPTGSSLSGTAATGSPIIGTVTVRDSATPFNTKIVTIAADGKYAIDVSGLTAPFMLRADGRVGNSSVSLYSAAISADINGTINITPLTDLIVANVAGQIASAYFAAGNFKSLTAAELADQEALLRSRLQPILAAVGVSASIDLLRSKFAADHSGLDRALDSLVVTVDPLKNTATILNKIDQQQIIDDLASKTDASVIVVTPNFAAGLSELQQIIARFDALTALFATSLPASNNAALLAMFDTGFLFDGVDTSQFVSNITSSSRSVGILFTSIALVPNSMAPSAAPTVARVAFSVIEGGGNGSSFEFTLKKVGTVWKFAGNGRISSANALSFARLQDVYINNVLQNNYIDTGLRFQIKAPTIAGLASLSPPIVVPAGANYYAVVTGPSLPASGALYVSSFSQNGGSFFAAGVAPSAYIGTSTQKLTAYGHNQYPLADASIGLISDDQAYLIKIYHDNATSNATNDDVLLASYSSNAGKRPYLKSELSVNSFAAITAPTKSALTAFSTSGGTTSIAWILPPTTVGAKSDSLNYFRSGNVGSSSNDVDVASTATSASLTINSASAAGVGTIQASGFNLTIKDNFSRELTTIYNAN